MTLKLQYNILQVIMASVPESGPVRKYFHAVELILMAVSPGSDPLLHTGDVCLWDIKSTEVECDGLTGQICSAVVLCSMLLNELILFV